MKQLEPNSLVQGRYLIVQMLGAGDVGEVYLAVDQRQGTAVALKRTDLNGDQTVTAAIEREAATLGDLSHPVLPKFIDHFIEKGESFLVMQHVPGDDFQKRLEMASKPFPLSWVMFWADQLSDALNYLHSHEPPMVHLDIKPKNLKLTDENHMMLLDSGLLRGFFGSRSASAESNSLAYASPEQLRHTGSDGRSDVYSLSATIYQLLTNTQPVDAETRYRAIEGGGEDPLPKLSTGDVEIPEPVANVIRQGMELKPEDRFLNAHDMQRALRRAYNEGRSLSEAKTRMFQSKVVTDQLSVAPTLETGVPKEAVAADAPKQADIKTEIFLAGALAAASPVSSGETEQAAEEAPPATVAAPAEVETSRTAAVPEVVMPTSKKSKKGLVVGAFGALVLLAVVVAAGGWYGYTSYYLPSKANVEPTPRPSVAPSPQVSPTIVATDVNKPANVAVEPGTAANSNNAVAITTHPTPVAANKPAANRNQPAGQKNTSKQKPRDERTVILQ